MSITNRFRLAAFLILTSLGFQSFASPINDPDCAITGKMWVKGKSTASEKLISAAAEGDLQKVVEALHLGASVNYSDEELGTPLAWASKCNNLQVVKALISEGADVNYKVSYQKDMQYQFKNSSALIWAASNDNFDVVKYLLCKGADPNRLEDIYMINEKGAAILLSKGRGANTVTEDKAILDLLKR